MRIDHLIQPGLEPSIVPTLLICLLCTIVCTAPMWGSAWMLRARRIRRLRLRDADAAVIIDELLTLAARPNEPYEPQARAAALQSARDHLIAFSRDRRIKTPRSASLPEARS